MSHCKRVGAGRWGRPQSEHNLISHEKQSFQQSCISETSPSMTLEKIIAFRVQEKSVCAENSVKYAARDLEHKKLLRKNKEKSISLMHEKVQVKFLTPGGFISNDLKIMRIIREIIIKLKTTDDIKVTLKYGLYILDFHS